MTIAGDLRRIIQYGFHGNCDKQQREHGFSFDDKPAGLQSHPRPA
jgi:hypothetical protein